MALSSPLFCDVCGAANRVQAAYCSVCGHALHVVPTSVTGSTTTTGLLNQQHILNKRYIILRQVGRGGFGAVYKATDMQFGNRTVAIKEMSQNNLTTQELQEASEAFKHEALLLAGLTHPNLPRIYEQFLDTGRSYLVMDFIEGETLEEHLNRLGRQRIAVEKLFDIALQLCSVLDYLHTRQPAVIFRDLKPANVMLTPDGHIYLIDFGIARHFKPGQTKDTAALGSSGYAAPEQYGRSQTTARADIYSFGATLHQLLTGADPADSPFHFASPTLPHPALSGLDKLVMSMVSVDIAQRPLNIVQVRQELQRIQTQYTISQTHPLPAALPGAYMPPAIHIAAPVAPTKTSRQRPTHQPVQPQLNTLYVCMGHSSRVTSLAWSPDGKLLASASYDKTVKVWDAITGQHIQTYHKHTKRVNELSWSPDSRCISTASDDGTVQVWEALSGKMLFTYTGHNDAVSAVSWSPNGLYIASAANNVMVWGVNTGILLYLYREHQQRIKSLSWSPDGRRIASGDKGKVHIWEPFQSAQKRSFLSSLLSLGRKNYLLNDHAGCQINCIAWSRDARRIASAGNDRRIVIGDLASGQSFHFHGSSRSDMKNAVVWSPSGTHLAIGGNDRTIEVLNVNNKKLKPFIYSGHTGYVMTVAWSPDGSKIASGGVDRTVQVWQVK